ncbi:MAG: cytochrome b/b6 domain-containing protein [Caldilineaceae bacterium]|nr:cytochrome b/b6 domain-containing protein [Caldilineaceae bacterium]
MTTQAYPQPIIHDGDHDLVLRYRRTPRIIHMMLAISFLLLLITGLALFLPWFSQYASGGTSRVLHRVGAIIYMAIPFMYLLVDRPAARELLWDSFHYDRDDLDWLLHVYRYFMGHAEGMPPQGRLNAGQKLHHAGVVIFSALIVISGIILWAGKGDLGPANLAIAVSIHDLSMLVLTVLLVGHLYFTFVYRALSGMTTGYIDEEDARLEHAKWVEELEREEVMGKE